MTGQVAQCATVVAIDLGERAAKLVAFLQMLLARRLNLLLVDDVPSRLLIVVPAMNFHHEPFLTAKMTERRGAIYTYRSKGYNKRN